MVAKKYHVKRNEKPRRKSILRWYATACDVDKVQNCVEHNKRSLCKKHFEPKLAYTVLIQQQSGVFATLGESWQEGVGILLGMP
ncbi:gag-pol polyprotein [Moniliophthora roreri]|nr:gag-pol polyprotein [Moniliophthora roreri]